MKCWRNPFTSTPSCDVWTIWGDPLPPPDPHPRYLSPQQHHDLIHDRKRWRTTIYRFLDPTKSPRT